MERERRVNGRQRGQAMVFVVLALPVALLALVFLYKAGRLTSEKMELQNAADSAAYSVSLVEARDLNFMAYTNRAMVANEVAIGQLVGLMSWANHVRSIGDFLRFYNTTFLAAPTLGISTAIIEPIASGFNVVGTTVGNILRPLGRTGTAVLHNINKAYGLAQQGFHASSVVFALTSMDEMIRQNAPGAKLSDFGFFSIIGHIVTYGPIDGLPGATFTNTYKPVAAAPAGATEPTDDQVGMERFASIVRASRDPFSQERGWTLPLFPPIHECASIDIVIASVGGCIDLELNLERRGGSELRYVGDGAHGQNFNHSAADTTSLETWLGVSFEVEVLGIEIGSLSVQSRNGQFEVNVSVAGIDIDFGPFPFPTGAPFSAGAAQAGQKVLTPVEMTLETMGGPVPVGSYGGSSGHLLAWTFPAPPGVMLQMPLNNVATKYRGLPRYTDTTGEDPIFGFQAPYVLIGLVREIDDINSSGPKPVGRLGLTDRAADDEVAAVAKAEVYFSRPNDLAYFLRLDGKTELGSTFNPYWHARLADSTFGDRVIALLIQQKELWIPVMTLPSFGSPPSLDDLLSTLGL